jgi:hypothetical protein
MAFMTHDCEVRTRIGVEAMMDPLWRKHNYNNGEIFTQVVLPVKTPFVKQQQKISVVWEGQDMLCSRNFPWQRAGCCEK